MQFGFGGDGDPAAIRTDRQQACDLVVDGGALVAPHQVHSPDVLTVTQGWPDVAAGRPEGDALVTNQSGIVLGIVTADCAPVLFCDEDAGVIGAAHAGWRGAYHGVLENTLDAMEALGAKRESIAAVIGPTIAQASYEVDDSFKNEFGASASQFFTEGQSAARPGHWQFDLPAYVADRLGGAGMKNVTDLALDTYKLDQKYYSYRRATHLGQANYGRQISLIGLA